MKKLSFFFFVLPLIFCSCGSNDSANSHDSNLHIENLESETIDNEELENSKILGVYQAVAPSYNLQDKYGEDMVINGKTIPIPSIDHKFILSKGGVVSLEQLNLDDNKKYYYEGTFKIIESNNEWKKVECSVSDGEYSNPKYNLTIYLIEETALVQKSNEPNFTLKKIK